VQGPAAAGAGELKPAVGVDRIGADALAASAIRHRCLLASQTGSLTATRPRGALAARLPGKKSPEQLAEGIIEIANWDQANAIRQMTIQRGIEQTKAGKPALLEFITEKAVDFSMFP